MSWQAISWVIEHSKHSGNPYLVLLMIANHASPNGTNSWPSLPTLARECRISRRTVWTCIKKLEESGELVVQRQRGRDMSNHYELPLMRKGAELLHLLAEEKVQIGGLKGANEEPKRCNSFAPELKEIRTIQKKNNPATALRQQQDRIRLLQRTLREQRNLIPAERDRIRNLLTEAQAELQIERTA